MGSRIDQLLEKYWNGKTTVEEERKLKNHFKQQASPSIASDYFNFLKKEKEIYFERKPKNRFRNTWLSAAATITIGVLTALLAIQRPSDDPFAVEDPKEALEATKRALMMIGLELNEGQSYALELTRINKAKEELSEEESEAL